MVKLEFIWFGYLYGYVEYGELRLFGSSYGNYRQLQFRWYNNVWGYVCSSGFDTTAARVACRELGYTYGYYDTEYYHW